MIGIELQKNVPNFDLHAFKQLQEDTSPETSLKILARFRGTLLESRQHIMEGCSQENKELIWKACHKIAGSAELLGFAQLGQESRRFSKSLQNATDLAPYMDDIINYQNYLGLVQKGIEMAFPNYSEYL